MPQRMPRMMRGGAFRKNPVCLGQDIALSHAPIAYVLAQYKIRLVEIFAVACTQNDHLLSRSLNHKILPYRYLTGVFARNFKNKRSGGKNSKEYELL